MGWEDIIGGEVTCKRPQPLACDQNLKSLKSDMDIQSVWENLVLGRIRKLVCDRREILFFAFF
jgi:hypothetical protein